MMKLPATHFGFFNTPFYGIINRGFAYWGKLSNSSFFLEDPGAQSTSKKLSKYSPKTSKISNLKPSFPKENYILI
jgi:hypothetical protein